MHQKSIAVLMMYRCTLHLPTQVISVYVGNDLVSSQMQLVGVDCWMLALE